MTNRPGLTILFKIVVVMITHETFSVSTYGVLVVLQRAQAFIKLYISHNFFYFSSFFVSHMKSLTFQNYRVLVVLQRAHASIILCRGATVGFGVSSRSQCARPSYAVQP